MQGFDNAKETLYNQYKDSMDNIEKIDKQLETLGKDGSPKPTLTMVGSRYSDSKQQFKESLIKAKSNIQADLDSKIDKYNLENNISIEEQKSNKESFSDRYQKEKRKDLDKSQTYLSDKLESRNALKPETNRDVNQSQDRAMQLLKAYKEKSQEPDSRIVEQEEVNNADHYMEQSFAKMDKQLEKDAGTEKEQSKETQKEPNKETDKE